MALNKTALKDGILALMQQIIAEKGSYEDFANGLADLIDIFVKTGTVTVAAGIPVNVDPGTHAGATSSTGTGTIS